MQRMHVRCLEHAKPAQRCSARLCMVTASQLTFLSLRLDDVNFVFSQ